MRAARVIAVLAAALLLMFALPLTVSAEDRQSERMGEIADGINSRIEESTDSGTKEILGGLELDVGSGEGIGGLTGQGVLGELWDIFFGELAAPSKMLGRLIAAAVLCTLAQSLAAGHAELDRLCRMLGALAAVLSVYGCLSDCITAAVGCLNELNVFMLSYIPVFAGVTGAAGGAAQGAAYYGTDLFLCEVTAFAAGKVIAPLLGVLTAVSAVGAIDPDIKLGGVAAAVKRAVQWLLGIMMTVFTGLLTVQNAVGAAADSAKSKAVRFAASSFIPVIGGSVSETYSAVRGSLGVIRAGTGSVGIIVIAAMVLRPLLILLAARAVMWAGRLCCGILGQEDMERFLGSVGSVLGIAMSIVICVSVMFVISTCIIMLTASGQGV